MAVSVRVGAARCRLRPERRDDGNDPRAGGTVGVRLAASQRQPGPHPHSARIQTMESDRVAATTTPPRSHQVGPL